MPQEVLTLDEVRQLLADACEKAGSQRQWALANGIAPPNVNAVLRGTEPPYPGILDALGLERVAGFRAKARSNDPQ